MRQRTQRQREVLAVLHGSLRTSSVAGLLDFTVGTTRGILIGLERRGDVDRYGKPTLWRKTAQGSEEPS